MVKLPAPSRDSTTPLKSHEALSLSHTCRVLPARFSENLTQLTLLRFNSLFTPCDTSAMPAQYAPLVLLPVLPPVLLPVFESFKESQRSLPHMQILALDALPAQSIAPSKKLYSARH